MREIMNMVNREERLFATSVSSLVGLHINSSWLSTILSMEKRKTDLRILPSKYEIMMICCYIHVGDPQYMNYILNPVYFFHS